MVYGYFFRLKRDLRQLWKTYTRRERNENWKNEAVRRQIKKENCLCRWVDSKVKARQLNRIWLRETNVTSLGCTGHFSDINLRILNMFSVSLLCVNRSRQMVWIEEQNISTSFQKPKQIRMVNVQTEHH